MFWKPKIVLRLAGDIGLQLNLIKFELFFNNLTTRNMMLFSEAEL